MFETAVRKLIGLLKMGLLIAVITVPAAVSLGQGGIIPGDDRDLDEIMTRIKPYEDLARQCSRHSCPEFDCDESAKAFRQLLDARQYLQYHHYWLKRATESHKAHFMQIARDNIELNEEIARAQNMVAWQEYFVNFGSTLLALSTATVSLKDLSNNAGALEEMSMLELLDDLDSLYEGVNDLETAYRNLREGLDPDVELGVDHGLGDEDLDNLKSTVSDLKTMIKEAVKNGNDWRRTLKSRTGRAALGAIVGRFAKMYADAEIEARKQRINKMMQDSESLSRTQAGLFLDLQRYYERRNKAEDALRAVSKLIVRDGTDESGMLLMCFVKVRGKCGTNHLPTVSKIRFDTDVSFDNYNILEDISEPERDWAKALKFFTGELGKVPELLKEPPSMDRAYVSLETDKLKYDPGETIRVKFRAPSCYPNNAWVGIVPFDVERGSERTNSDRAFSGRSFLRHRETGEMTFKAPDKPGRYDLRMNDPESGRETFALPFTVSGDDTASASTAVGGSCPAGPVIAYSNFSAGTEGWSLAGDGRDLTALDGYIKGTDNQDGIAWYFIAPSEFLGDRSDAYGGSISFELNQLEKGSQKFVYGVLGLTDGTTSLWYDPTPDPPAQGWTVFDICLKEGDGWTAKTGDEEWRPATRADFEKVLGDLRELKILPEHSSRKDVGGLRNVVMRKGN